MKKTYQEPTVEVMSFTSMDPITFNSDNNSVSIEDGWEN